jgi:bifunctional polynucleotide phosphatase/kinase
MNDVVLQPKISRRSKFAIFDFDWTIVKPKEGRKFPKDVDDWQYIRESVPRIVKKYAKDHQIVIVTDQSKAWKIEQIQHVLADLEVEATVIIGVKTQKPDTALFNKVFPKYDPEKLFYVGDAAGREGDWSDKDKLFASNLGIKFFSPEEIFPLDPVKALPKNAAAIKKREVVIMMGYPASGKSTIAKGLDGYYRVDGDSLKTAAAMVKDAKKHVAEQSIVFDSTAGTKERRGEFVKFAKEHDLPVRVFWVQTSIDESMERNKQRALTGIKKIPDIAFYMFRKKFEEPSEDEGFVLVKI